MIVSKMIHNALIACHLNIFVRYIQHNPSIRIKPMKTYG